ncbi:MAG: hypothetical protein P0Y53_15805 [Candidatus Pseudobacter hemicellulosilyticus]|uniref:Uncharacterized protein n=1 Tax=Candidatus Pseudobacter hemicellulosilyticus TaxID=3121375 RepID=A0AAJ5WP28_9BACT|nr:MAG: hypothetical protein P0Y53_15805 [Pseudobacter sp.]
MAGIADDYSPYAYVLNNPLLYNDPYGLDTTRGQTPTPTPDPGDIWIPDEGLPQVFDPERGWAPQIVMDDVIVTPANNDQDEIWYNAFANGGMGVGVTGTYYGLKGNVTHNEFWWRKKWNMEVENRYYKKEYYLQR